MKRLLLIDGSNLMFRAYYATAYGGPLMQNSDGQYTNAVFAFVNMINKFLQEDFTHIFVAFDESGKTFRHDTFKDYKAGRPKVPEEFLSQFPLIKESCDVLGIKRDETHLIEADDIIGTYTTKYYEDFDEIEIISNDKDLLQLINDKVTLHTTQRGKKPDIYYTENYLKEKMGVTPAQITDMKGLSGDSSDNLPGIPRIGDKTALKLLNEYDTLENVIEHKDEITGKLGERVREYYEDAIMCKKLATIKTDVALKYDINDIEYKGVDEEKMNQFFTKLDLHSLIKRNLGNTEREIDMTYDVVDDPYELEDYLIDDTTIILESFGDNYHKAKPLGFALHNDKGNIFVPYEMLHRSVQFQLFLKDETLTKNVFNLKAMKVILKNDLYDISGVSFDLLLAAYILNPANTKEDFRVIVSNFDYTDVAYNEEIYSKGRNYSIPEAEVYQSYAVQKAVAVKELQTNLTKQLKDKEQFELFKDIELPLASVLADMEYEGITVDQDKLDELDEELSDEIASLTNEIHSLAGEEFNVSSPKQLGHILFEKLELSSGKKTKTGFSTAASVLEKIKDEHPIIEKVLSYRTYTKIHSTYIEGMRSSIYDDGKIHTIYRQAFTSTGRLSSIEPNLQNIPIRYEIGRRIRKIFVPSKAGNKLLASDYSQIELRVLAHMAEEKELIKSYKEDKDIHTITAQKIFDKEVINSHERRQAKAVNFGLIYGQTDWGLSQELDISKKEATKFIEKYYKNFPDIKGFMDKVIKQTKEREYFETIFKRRRYIPEINSSVYMQRQAGERNAMNAPIQGSAADIIKIAMIDIDKALRKLKLNTKLLLQIHDELVFEVDKDEIAQVKKLVKQTMENCVSLKVPLKVDSAMGDNLYETK
ncbi:MAG: DNA polymerase I [Candidatus Izimaplasma sp.]|nr:DNA polymerase I [Candidatus Izimaplasma bacterium]